MLNKEELKSKVEAFNNYLNQKPGTEPNDLIERAENLTIMIAQSGQCLADAKYLQEQAINTTIQMAIDNGWNEKLGTSTVNKFVNSAASEFNYLVYTLDKINSSAVHALDAVRSILSYRKSELNL